MKNKNRFMKRFTFLALASYAACTGLANQEYVTGDGYWKPESGDFISESDGTHLNPYGTRILIDTIHKDPERVTLIATPDKGWSVDHWRKSFIQSFSELRDSAGKEISNTKGALSYTQEWESGDPVFIAVKFKYLDYNLTYDGNGAASPARLSAVSYTNQFALAAAPQAPAGLSFASWRDPSGKEFSAGASVSGESFAMLDDAHVDGTNVTLMAVWSTNSYTVAFNPDGGIVDVPSKSVTYGQPYGELPTPAWDEHEFQGWYLGQSQVTAESIVQITADSELKAKWSQKTYTVSFAMTGDGEGEVDPVSVTASSGQSVAVQAKPAENSRFLCWSDGNTDASRTIVVESNATYTATFEVKKYTVTFYWFCADGTPTNESQIVRWGEDAVEPQDIPIRTGYIRQGWEKSFTEVKSNLDIRAHYEALEYTVTFLTDGGTGTGTVDQTSRPWPYGEKFTVSATPATGSEFVKWSDGDVSNPREITVTEPAVYTAVFDLIRYDVTFNWRIGDNVATQETQKVAWGMAATPPVDSAVDSRVGYSWTGWDVSPDEFVAVKSNLTANAHYTPHEYTVVYDVTGNKEHLPPPEAQPCQYDKHVTLRRGEYNHEKYRSADGWDFYGWKCGDEIYVVPSAGDVIVSNLTAEAGGVVTMKAVWDVGDLSRAMKCDNLYWRAATDPGWEAGQEAAVCSDVNDSGLSEMYAPVSTNGILRFEWKVECAQYGELYVYVESPSGTRLMKEEVVDGAWHTAEVKISQPDDDQKVYLGLDYWERYPLPVLTAKVRNVTWTPDGANPDPKPGDAVTISSAEISGNQFKLSFTSDEQFGYNLLTNANLLIDSWGVKEYRPGGGTITFEPEIESGVPQMFYKVETIRKK